MEIIKILSICLTAAILCLVLKQYKAEYALFISIFAGVFVLSIIVKNIFTPIHYIMEKIESLGVEIQYFKTALKALGIGYITNFISDSCRECGQLSLASKAELAGKVSIFIISIPLAISILETAIGFIK